MKPEFNIGDEVFLEIGCYVDTEVEEKYVYKNKPFSDKKTNARIQLGIKYTTEDAVKRDIKEEANHIANIIWRSFLHCDYEVSFEECLKFVQNHIDVNKKLELTEFFVSEGIFIIKELHYHPTTPAYGHINYSEEHYSYTAVRKGGDNRQVHFEPYVGSKNNWHLLKRHD